MGYLKNTLGQIFSAFALYRFFKRMLQKATGRLPTGKPLEMNLNEFQNFEQKLAAKPKLSRKPFIIFFVIVVGLPYLMHKLIKVITSKQQEQQQQLQAQGGANTPIDPSKLEFARATYDFTAESQMELSLKKNDIVAILSKTTEPGATTPGQWWRGRLRDGKMGLFPANYVEIIQKGPAPGNNEPTNNIQNTDLKTSAIAPITPPNEEVAPKVV
jgi:peroxin-13